MVKLKINSCDDKFTLFALLLLFGVACLGSIFLPSNECELTLRTLSTASGVENVMNPKPLLLCYKL